MQQRDPLTIYISTLTTPSSKKTMRHCLKTIVDFLSSGQSTPETFDWGSLRYDDTCLLKDHLVQTVTPSTVNLSLSAYRGVLKAAMRMGQVPGELYFALTDVRNLPCLDTKPGRMIPVDELKKLLGVCQEDTLVGIRDRALLSVMLNSGARRSEIVALNIGDYSPQDRTLRIRNGKFHQYRNAYLSSSAAADLDRWLAIRKGTKTDPLFPAIRRGGTIEKRRISSALIYLIVRTRAKQAGIEDIAPHDFRRTLISSLLEEGVDLSLVSRMVGHTHIKHTVTYDRRPELASREAIQKLNLGE